MGAADPALHPRGGRGAWAAITTWSRGPWRSSKASILRCNSSRCSTWRCWKNWRSIRRAYDFDHPVNKRPNYLFGQWDLGKLDNAGRCRRFVLQQVSLDAMMERIEHRGSLPYEEMLYEAAAVLAGTILMGSRISGNRPEAHDSSVTLSSLVQQIAVYRDAFYERLLAQLQGPHAERLRAEALAVRQPFGGVRQHFNQHLARRRAEQLQHVHLAEVFARMGYTEAAQRQVRVVPVASARLKCDIHCRLTTAHLAIEEVQSAAVRAPPAGQRGRPACRLDAAPRTCAQCRSGCWKNRSACCTARSSAGPWSIPGTFSASAGNTASSPRRRTASTIIASTS